MNIFAERKAVATVLHLARPALLPAEPLPCPWHGQLCGTAMTLTMIDVRRCPDAAAVTAWLDLFDHYFPRFVGCRKGPDQRAAHPWDRKMVHDRSRISR